jgi:hypothetical protein
VWVYKGDVLAKGEQPAAGTTTPSEEEAPGRRLRRAPAPRPAARPEAGAPAPGEARPKPAAPRGRAKKAEGDVKAPEAAPAAPAAAPKKPALKRVVKKSTGGSNDASTS